MMTASADLNNELWVGAGGAMLVLFRSILDGTRRTWYALLIGCILGGGGAAMAGYVFSDSKWVYPICGVAAVMTENVILGFFKASQEFRDAPIKVFSQLFRLVVPAFGRNAGAPMDEQPVAPTPPQPAPPPFPA